MMGKMTRHRTLQQERPGWEGAPLCQNRVRHISSTCHRFPHVDSLCYRLLLKMPAPSIQPPLPRIRRAQGYGPSLFVGTSQSMLALWNRNGCHNPSRFRLENHLLSTILIRAREQSRNRGLKQLLNQYGRKCVGIRAAQAQSQRLGWIQLMTLEVHQHRQFTPGIPLMASVEKIYR